ncbi:MAG: RDD family protein [Nitratireductor sp.]|nr:RDD family protein [Nitratireductor sp.]MCB1421474.1 RDD family protein [Nitratireductor sp.]
MEHYGASPRLEGVRTRRVLAFIVDYLIVAVLTMIAMVAVFFIGILTFGLGWLLYFVLAPLVAMAYVGSTMGGPAQATPGMQFFSIRIERDDGAPVDFFLAILHGVIFWVAHITLTPFLLVVALFSERKRLVQDILLGTSVVRSDIG